MRGGGRGRGAGAATYYPPGAVASAQAYPAALNLGAAATARQAPYSTASAQASAYAAYGLAPPASSPSASAASSLPSQRGHEAYLAGPGRAQAQMRFLSEGLRQQLQHNSYLIQAQVGCVLRRGNPHQACTCVGVYLGVGLPGGSHRRAGKRKYRCATNV